MRTLLIFLSFCTIVSCNKEIVQVYGSKNAFICISGDNYYLRGGGKHLASRKQSFGKVIFAGDSSFLKSNFSELEEKCTFSYVKAYESDSTKLHVFLVNIHWYCEGFVVVNDLDTVSFDRIKTMSFEKTEMKKIAIHDLDHCNVSVYNFKDSIGDILVVRNSMDDYRNGLSYDFLIFENYKILIKDSSITLNDAECQKVLFDLNTTYHFLGSFSIGGQQFEHKEFLDSRSRLSKQIRKALVN